MGHAGGQAADGGQLFLAPHLFLEGAHPAFGLLLAGGLCYTLGCGFYLAKKVPYLHFVWHMFVLAGATCITLSALLFIV